MKKPTDFSISLNETQAIKGIAIIAMLLHHLFYEHPEYGEFVHQVGLVGKVCVALFLFVSGYGLSAQYKKLSGNSEVTGKQSLRFIIKRLIKFYLNYWIVFIIFVPIGVFVFNRGLEVPYGDHVNILKNLCKDFWGLNSFSSYNITWWFNRLILTLYVVFPIIYYLAKSSNKYILIVLCVFAYLEPNYFPFIIGVLIAQRRRIIEWKINHYPTKILLLTSLALLIVLIAFRQFSPIPKTNGLYVDGLIAMAISFLVVCIARIRLKEYVILSYLGKHSMNIYLIHTFIFYYFFSDFIYSFRYPILIFIALLVSSLTVSITLEFVKKIIGIYKLQNYLVMKIQR